MLEPNFDVAAAHKYFSAACFNRAWDLIDKDERSETETEEMIRLSEASLWHWSERADCTDRNRSIGHWQLARVYALAGRAVESERNAQQSLDYANRDPSPFHVGYAHEAIARAAVLHGKLDRAREHIALAAKLAEQVENAQNRDLLLADLAAVREALE